MQIQTSHGSPNIGFKVTKRTQLRSLHSHTSERPETLAHLNHNSLRPGNKDPADSSIPRPLGCQDYSVRYSCITIKPLLECPMPDNSHMGLLGPSACWVFPSGPLNPTALILNSPASPLTSPWPPTRLPLFLCHHALSYLGQKSLPVPPSPFPHPMVDSLTLFFSTSTTIPFQSGPCLQDCPLGASFHPTRQPVQLTSPGKAGPLVPPPDPLPPPHPFGSLHRTRAGPPRAHLQEPAERKVRKCVVRHCRLPQSPLVGP